MRPSGRNDIFINADAIEVGAQSFMSFLKKDNKIKILFVTTEEVPFAQVGGLGEVMFALPRALRALGHDARVMIPYYGTINKNVFHPDYIFKDLSVPTEPDNGGKGLICSVRMSEKISDSRSPVPTYFLENQEYYETRANIYGYMDDRVRFALFSRGCLEFLNFYRDWTPDIIVTTDWMTGYLPNLLKTDYKDYRNLQNIATLFSIHNLSSQGTVRHHQFLQETERDDGHGSLPDFFSERMLYINAMRRGIIYSDLINTVSPTYAEEITTVEFGEGLDPLLREKRGRLFGVLNGIDYITNNPETDPYLVKNFSVNSIHCRVENKIALQKRFGLPQDENIFMLGVVSRLVRQKGFELLEPILTDFIKETNAQLIVLGTGDTSIMDIFQKFEKDFPSNIRTHFQFEDTLPHLIYAGCDVLLVPSKFEPSGLIQMEAMRFGAVPIARKTGGLADTIDDYAPETDKGDGFLFTEFKPNALLVAMTRAFVNWRYKERWRELQKRAMIKDFSWNRSAREYIALFKRAIKLHAQDISNYKEKNNGVHNYDTHLGLKN